MAKGDKKDLELLAEEIAHLTIRELMFVQQQLADRWGIQLTIDQSHTFPTLESMATPDVRVCEECGNWASRPEGHRPHCSQRARGTMIKET